MTVVTDDHWHRMSTREKVYKYLEVEADDRGLERALNVALALLIVLNIACVVAETVQDFYAAHVLAFHVFEVISVTIFSVEYLLRVWTCTEDPRYRHPVFGRVRYVFSPMALIDLVAILPSFLPGVDIDLRFARAIRLLRLLRCLKFLRYSRSLQLLGHVLQTRRQDLAVTAMAGSVVLTTAACAMYYAEHDAQPKAFSSIPAAMWWAVVTLTTVGYGDVYPITLLGRTVAGITAMIGVGLFALPAGILASAFAEELQKMKKAADAPSRCPHCGKEIPHD